MPWILKYKYLAPYKCTVRLHSELPRVCDKGSVHIMFSCKTFRGHCKEVCMNPVPILVVLMFLTFTEVKINKTKYLSP